MKVEGEFPSREWIRVTGMQMYVNGSATSEFPALDSVEQLYGRPLRDYLQRLFLGREQAFGSVNELMPSFRTDDNYPPRYILPDSECKLLVENSRGRVEIKIETGKRKWFSPEPAKIPVAEVRYEIIRAEKPKTTR